MGPLLPLFRGQKSGREEHILYRQRDGHAATLEAALKLKEISYIHSEYLFHGELQRLKLLGYERVSVNGDKGFWYGGI